MVVTHSSWHKTRLPFLWYRVSGAYLDRGSLYHAWLDYRFFWRNPCNHRWVERDLHGDERLERDAIKHRRCQDCGKVELE